MLLSSSKTKRNKRHLADCAKRTSNGLLRFELLEDRVLMNADNSLAVALSQPASAQAMMAADTTGQTTEQSHSSALPEQFGSAEAAKAWLIEQIDAQFGHKFGTTHGKYNYPFIDLIWNEMPWESELRIIDVPLNFQATGSVSNDSLLRETVVAFSVDHSNTNIQTAAVDEADLVETDGKYLYILSGNDLVIVEAGLGDDLKVASRITLDHRPQSMYLVGEQLVLLHDKPKGTEVTLLDISDREAPELIQRTTLDGRIVSSRVVGDSLRMVLQSSITLPPLESTLLNDGAASDSSGNNSEKYVYETREEYFNRVGDQLLETVLPGYSSFTTSDGMMHDGLMTDPAEIFRSKSDNFRRITSIVSFDLSNPEPGPTSSVSLITGNTSLVYASQDNIYITETRSGSQTHITKIGFDDTTHAVQLLAMGSVQGRVADQFSLDEHDGYLRVVTSDSSRRDGHKVFVLEQQNDCLEVVGLITGIAKGENLHSVRFMGDRGFFVTFRKVDPLFALDLSDPTNPAILGELKIPGFSDYLQPIDANHLIGIGRGADESIGRFQEMQVSLFDISDLTNPILLDRYSFEGGRSTKSEALNDHHAVSYFGAEGVLAFPIHSISYRSGFRFGVDNTPIWQPGQGALQVLRVDVNSGFEHLGQVQHDSLVHRSVRIEDHLFAISNGQVTVHDLYDPSDQLGAVAIGSHSGQQGIWLNTYAQAQGERAAAVAHAMASFDWSASPSAAAARAMQSDASSIYPSVTAVRELVNVLPVSQSLDSQAQHRYRVLDSYFSTHREFFGSFEPDLLSEQSRDSLRELALDQTSSEQEQPKHE